MGSQIPVKILESRCDSSSVSRIQMALRFTIILPLLGVTYHLRQVPKSNWDHKLYQKFQIRFQIGSQMPHSRWVPRFQTKSQIIEPKWFNIKDEFPDSRWDPWFQTCCQIPYEIPDSTWTSRFLIRSQIEFKIPNCFQKSKWVSRFQMGLLIPNGIQEFQIPN